MERREKPRKRSRLARGLTLGNNSLCSGRAWPGTQVEIWVLRIIPVAARQREEFRILLPPIHLRSRKPRQRLSGIAFDLKKGCQALSPAAKVSTEGAGAVFQSDQRDRCEHQLADEDGTEPEQQDAGDTVDLLQP